MAEKDGDWCPTWGELVLDEIAERLLVRGAMGRWVPHGLWVWAEKRMYSSEQGGEA